ncbi:MAG TPA: BON domain-containing protein [Verrucomicrobiae bacterium]|jgi:gas vesicle protein
MKGFIVGCLFGAVVLAAAVWYFRGPADRRSLEDTRDRVAADARDAGTATKNKLDELGLTSDNIKDELSRTGKVIRRKSESVGHALSDAAADARITAAIKAKLVGDPDLSAVAISVSTTDGCVTLSGSASSPDNIRKAMTLAYNTEGVNQVVSTLMVKPSGA